MRPEHEADDDDPRLTYLPRILIVTTNGVEIDLLLPPYPARNVHWAQAWKPLACQCGVVHAPCWGPAELVLLIGPRDPTIHHHPGVFAVYILPRPIKRVPENATEVVYAGEGGFGPWAADVVLNLVGPQSRSSFWRYDLADLKRMMGRARSWSCVSAAGDLAGLGPTIVTRVPSSATELHVSLCVSDNGTGELADFSATLNAVQEAVRQDASILLSHAWGLEMRVTVLFSSEP